MLNKLHGEAAAFWKEAAHKETAVRFKWLETYAEECEQSHSRAQERMQARRDARRSMRGTSSTMSVETPAPSGSNVGAPTQSRSAPVSPAATAKEAKYVREVCASRKSLTLPPIEAPPAMLQTKRQQTMEALSATAPRPVPEDVRARLFDGISKEGGGRAKYLKKRNSMPLEDKYGSPQTTTQAMSFGTSNIMSPSVNPGPRHGRRRVVGPSFFRKDGIPLGHPHMAQ